MAYTYPGTGPTVVGDNVQVSKFLNSPTLVQRRVNELANQRYVTDVLLSGRTPDVTGGAVQYEVDEDNFTVREPESVSLVASTPSLRSRKPPPPWRRSRRSARTPS